MNKEILARSKQVKKDADKLLSDSKLLELLGRFGKVEITGSHALDLMLTGDIDIHLFGQFDRKKAQEVLDALIVETKMTGYMFFDWVTYQNPAFPNGYYLGIKQKMDGYNKQWKIDIWLISEARPENINYMELLKNCSEEEKIAILTLKEWRDESDPGLSSTEIYDAVMKKGIKTVEEFKRTDR